MNGNLGIGDMTIGASREGLETYIEDLHLTAFQEVVNEIDNVTDFETAVNNCWQGESKDRFLSHFAEMREVVKSDLEAEYQNLENKIRELVYGMLSLDSSGIYYDK